MLYIIIYYDSGDDDISVRPLDAGNRLSFLAPEFEIDFTRFLPTERNALIVRPLGISCPSSNLTFSFLRLAHRAVLRAILL